MLLLVLSVLVSPVWYDDAGHYLVIRQLVDGGEACYPVHLAVGDCRPDSPFITMGPALNWPLAGWLWVTGGEMLGARWFMVLLTLGSLGVYWLLGRDLLGRGDKAWWALALVGGSIQLLTYGAEVLGEVPMLGWVFLGFWGHVRWLGGRGWQWAGLGVLSWWLAVLNKEYIGVPLAVGLVAWWVCVLVRRDWKRVGALAVQGLVLGLLVGGYHVWRAGGLTEALEWFRVRQSYGSEFLAFEVVEGIRFLALKPLIWLGMGAMVIKVWTKRAVVDVFLLCMQVAWVLFFLCSAGYDRFGFQLIFLPGLYLAEFVVLIWTRWALGRGRRVLRVVVFGVVFVGLFWQRSVPVLMGRLLDGQAPNAAEHEMVGLLGTHGVGRIFTYDQQLVPFLDGGVEVRLSPVVPSAAEMGEGLVLGEGEWFVAGAYGFTEYDGLVDWEGLERVAACGEGEQAYVLYRRR